MFLGIDGLDGEMVTSLRKQGELPNLAKLMREGVSARVNTDEERAKASAAYWTTIATGVRSEKHGINGFVIIDPQTGQQSPFTSNMRASKALWNILSERGISVGIVGWYVTYPVERVKGFMVSSYYALGGQEQPTWKGTLYTGAADMIYPKALEKMVHQRMQEAEESYHHGMRGILKPKALKARKKIVVDTEWVVRADEIYRVIGIDLYKKIRPRVFAVYFSGIDVIGHRFTSGDNAAQKELIDEFGDVHRKYYLYLDKVVGDFVRLADNNTLIIIATDHGIMRGEHTNNGACIISGPHIKRNVRAEKVINLTDFLPTMLYLLRVPVAKDMDGQVFKEAIAQEYLDANEVLHIDSYGKREITNSAPRKSNFDGDIVERLKSLGYLN